MMGCRTWSGGLIVAVALTAGCASPRTAPGLAPMAPAAQPASDTIILLADEDAGTIGRVVVSSQAGHVTLTEAWASARVSRGGAPVVASDSSAERRARVRQTLDALPAASRHFTLYFGLASEVLTAESMARLLVVRATALEHPLVEVVVIGHTDRSGGADENVELGLARAETVRSLLLEADVAASAIRITSHGEADPAVPTSDGVVESRNRRVEITVR